MSKQDLDEVIRRAASDSEFRNRLDDNFSGATRQYDLGGDEQAQLRRALGIRAESGATALPVAAAASTELASSDLSSADLSSADLSSADLSSADLSSTDLSSADLSSADLSSADLSSADLSTLDVSTVDHS